MHPSLIAKANPKSPKSDLVFRDGAHDHYWMEDGQLFESYWRFRGLRWRALSVTLPFPEFQDVDQVDQIYMDRIEKFLKTKSL